MPFNPATPPIGSTMVSFSQAEAITAAEEFAYMRRSFESSPDLIGRVLQAATESLINASERHLAIGASLILHSRTITGLADGAYRARKLTASRKLSTLASNVSALGVNLLTEPESARIRTARHSRRSLGRTTREMFPAGLFDTLRTLESEILSLRRSGAFADAEAPETESSRLESCCEHTGCFTGVDGSEAIGPRAGGQY